MAERLIALIKDMSIWNFATLLLRYSHTLTLSPNFANAEITRVRSIGNDRLEASSVSLFPAADLNAVRSHVT